MRRRIISLLGLLAAVGCVGPEQHVRGGHYGGYHHHHGGGQGFLALLDGVAALAELAEDVSYIAAANPAPPPTVVVASPSPPAAEPVRTLLPSFQGRLDLPHSSRVTLPELRIGLRPTSGGAESFLAIFHSDVTGRFFFTTPPAGSYAVVVLDSDYQGELTFTADGKTTFPLVLPVAVRPKQPTSAAKL